MAASTESWIKGTITLQTRTQVLPRQAGTARNHFLFVTSDWLGMQPGGVSAYLHSLAQGLISLGDTVKMLAIVQLDEKERIRFLETYEAWMIPFQVTHDVKPTHWLGRKCVSLLEILRCLSPKCRRLLERTSFFEASTASITRVERLLSKERPTTIVFGDIDFRLYPVALFLQARKRPYGIIAHGREVGRRSDDKINGVVIRKVMLKGARWIAANSRHTKSLIEAWGIPENRIKIVHPPISEEAIRESGVSEPTPGEDDSLALVTVCRLVRDKGIDLVIRALKILAARGIPYRYVIGGEGPERGPLEALADELGLRDKVHFRGWVDAQEKWSLLRSADVLAMTSRADSKVEQEGFGIAFVEAAAFGVPAVGSRSGGIPDAVVDGETGILVPEESPVDLADALTFLYRNPERRKEMGKAARERARRQFAPQVIAARFREISSGVQQ